MSPPRIMPRMPATKAEPATFARQSAVLDVAINECHNAFHYFLNTRASKAERYPDYVAARMAASETLKTLALMERAFGTDKVKGWLDESAKRATATLREKERGAA